MVEKNANSSILGAHGWSFGEFSALSRQHIEGDGMLRAVVLFLMFSTIGSNAAAWQPRAFNPEIKHLPARYVGTDPKKFYSLLKSRLARIEKGEYETSAEFAARTSDADATLAPIKTSVEYAFRAPVTARYEPDYEYYKFDMDSDCNLVEGGGLAAELITCRLAKIRRETSQYVGSNAFGASREVDRVRGLDFSLALKFDEVYSLVNRMTYPLSRYVYSDTLSMPLEKARRLKGKSIGVLWVGRVLDAKLINGRGLFVSPTLDNLADIYVTEEALPFSISKSIYYVFETGEILGQKELTGRLP